MEIIFCLLMVFTIKKHSQGFSSIELPGGRAVYFFSFHTHMDVYINGQLTGVKAPGILYFPQKTQEIFVEYKVNGIRFFSKRVQLNAEKTLVMGQITPVINLLA